MKTIMFPGQGSQSKGMGASLFEEFSDILEKADEILGYSLRELCIKDPRKELNQTQFTQPALYVVNALSYLEQVERLNHKPDFILGHSLGEFNALLAAECFDFETGLKIVKKRGELMSEAPEGRMAAILNATKEEIETILAKNGLTNIDLVNYNTLSQIVISGNKDEISRAESLFQQDRMLYYPINTSGAFHSRFMRPAAEKFSNYLKNFKLSELKIPVIANITGRPYQNDKIRENLSNQMACPVKWSDSIQYLMNLDDNPTNAMEFKEIGYGNTLTKMVDKLKKEITESFNKYKSPVRETHQESQQPIATAHDSFKNEHKVPKDSNEAEKKVSAWNQKYPIGTKVTSSIMENNELETRTEAIVLFGHRAAIYLSGYNGYFDLDEINPVYP